MATRNRTTTPCDQLPTHGSMAESATGLTLWCDADACSRLRAHGYRYQVIYTTKNLAAIAETYGPAVIFPIGKSASSARPEAAEVRPRRLPPIALLH